LNSTISTEINLKILLALDDSQFSAAATKEIVGRPWPARTTVRVLSVVEPVPPPAAELWYDASGSLQNLEKELRSRAAALTTKAGDKLKKHKLKVETVVQEGDARSTIVDEARKCSADLIVMGSHGYTGIKRLLLGSVASFVVNHAPCSVEIVRKKEKKK
jgi:nucleotide-binding universal stress UspA family protein